MVEHVLRGGDLFAVRLETRDTTLPFGPASLDRHSRTFLGLPKSGALSEDDKMDMLATFRTKTADAYGYAVAEAVNTLLVYEQMRIRDYELYKSFGFADEDVPLLQAFLGGRVSTFLAETTRLGRAAGSAELSSRGKLGALMRKGGVALFDGNPEASKFGAQVGGVHGGLLFSRSPARLWHEAPGMLADVDLAGC